MALYKEDQKITIAELLNLNEKKKSEVLAKYRELTRFTVLSSDISTTTSENHRGEDRKRIAVPAGKWIPSVYTTEIGGESVTLRYADNRKPIKGVVNGWDYSPSHIEINGSTGGGVLILERAANEEQIFFLKHHPLNKSNPIYEGDKPKRLPVGQNFLFMEFNGGKRADEALKKRDMITLVTKRIRGEEKLTDENLRATAQRCIDLKMDTFFYDVYEQKMNEIQAELLRLADIDCETINKMLSSWENEIEIVVRAAMKRNILTFESEGKVWKWGADGSTQSVIVHVNDATDSVRFLVTHLNTKDTENYYAIMVKALGMKNVPQNLVEA